jgi:hypothetical protein
VGSCYLRSCIRTISTIWLDDRKEETIEFIFKVKDSVEGNQLRKMRLKKKVILGRELAKVMRGEKDIRRPAGITFGSQPSVNRETPTTTTLVV